MKKQKGRLSINTQFVKALQLTEDQIVKINQIEQQLHKEYFWNHRLDKDSFVFRLIRRVFKELSDEQIKRLKLFKSEYTEKANLKKQSRLQKSFESQSKRLQSLKLSEEQLWQFVQAKSEWLKVYKKKNLEIIKEGGNQFSEELKEEIDKELFQPIFTTKQFEQYHELVRRENELQQEWRLKQSKSNFENRYSTILTEHQAKGICDIEQKRWSRNEKGELLSDFEQEELKLQAYKQILNEKQLEIYHKEFHARIDRMKQDLIKSNEGHHLHELKRIQSSLEYYTKRVLPLKVKSRVNLEKRLNQNHTQYLDQLKKEYMEILRRKEIKIREDHKRFNLNLVPNELKAHLLRIEFSKIQINPIYLRDSKLIKEVFSEDLINDIKLEENKLGPTYKDFKEFQIKAYEENGGDYGGWIHKVVSKEDNRNLQYLSLLLLEPNLEENLARLNLPKV